MGPAGRAPSFASLAVGDEVVRGEVADTNGARLARWASESGLRPGPRATVGDDERDIARALRFLLRLAEVVAVIGGLGPTPDDVTREGVARALGLPLAERPELRRALARLYSRRGMELTSAQLRQASLPLGAVPIENRVGTAPGFWLQAPPRAEGGPGRYVIVLPGPPRELAPMEADVRALFRAWFPEVRPPVERRLQVAGYGESLIAERVARALGAGAAAPGLRLAAEYAAAGVTFATYLRAGAVEVRISGPPEAEAAVAQAAQAAEAALAPWVFSHDEPGLAPAIAKAASARRVKVAVAESCTAGLVGAALASVPGASDWFRGGVLAYVDDAKRDLLGVPADVLRSFGAVSAEAAEAMAQGASRALGADLAVSVTCFAGPAGGTPQDPVGTVYLGWADGARTGHVRRVYHGPRDAVRERAAWEALVVLWARLHGLDPEGSPHAARRAAGPS